MSLIDVLRTQTLEIEDAVSANEGRIRDLGSEKRTCLSRIEVLEKEIASKRSQSAEEDARIRELEARTHEIERQIEELRQQHQQLIEERGHVSVELTNFEQETSSLVEDKKRAQTSIERCDGQVRQLVSEKARLRERLISARRIALESYFGDLANRLAQVTASQEQQSDRILARKKLEELRHKDSEVMSLYETRTELQKFLQMASISAVRDQLQQQLMGVEARIEERFPGALSVEAPSSSSINQIEEIFFTVDGGGSRILLPIGVQTWHEIAKGEQGSQTQSALRLVWGLGKAFSPIGGKPRLKVQGNLIVMEVENDLSEMGEIPDIEVPLPGSGSMAFLVSKLPHELQEVVGDEDTRR